MNELIKIKNKYTKNGQDVTLELLADSLRMEWNGWQKFIEYGGDPSGAGLVEIFEWIDDVIAPTEGLEKVTT